MTVKQRVLDELLAAREHLDEAIRRVQAVPDGWPTEDNLDEHEKACGSASEAIGHSGLWYSVNASGLPKTQDASTDSLLSRAKGAEDGTMIALSAVGKMRAYVGDA